MTGIVSAAPTAFGVALVVLSPLAALAIVDASVAVAVGAGMGTVGLAGVSWLYIRRSRLARPRPLTGWRIPAAALLSLAFGAGGVIAAFSGSVTAASILVVLGAALGVRCTVARRMELIERMPPEETWTDEDRDWLVQTGAALPETQERQQ